MIRGSAVISGDFTRAEADRIASGLGRRAAAAAGTSDATAQVRETPRSVAVPPGTSGAAATAAPGSSAVAPILFWPTAR